jgi:lathosterol oxidase
MDIILELFDTFVFDPIYAQILPASPRRAPYGSFKDGASNATLSSRREIPTSFVYEPASQYLSFTPSKSAYMSSWNRDNIYRQAISLYLITWYRFSPFYQEKAS